MKIFVDEAELPGEPARAEASQTRCPYMNIPLLSAIRT